jgi:hypothetical protein
MRFDFDETALPAADGGSAETALPVVSVILENIMIGVTPLFACHSPVCVSVACLVVSSTWPVSRRAARRVA